MMILSIISKLGRDGDKVIIYPFNIVTDMLAILKSRAKDDVRVGGLVPHLVEGVIHSTMCEWYYSFHQTRL
jgi:predicted thioredoxin/glutaredoxin